MSTDLILLGISLMIWGVGEGMFFIFQPLYLQQLGADPVMIGVILGAAAVAMAVAHIPAGHLADRIGRKPLLLGAWGLGLAAIWIMALAPNLSIFIIGMLVYNLTAFVSSPLSSYVTAARGKFTVGRVLTFISAIYNSGAILGPWVGGQAGQHYGLRSIYVIAGCLFVFSTIILLFIKPQPIDPKEPDGKSDGSLINRRFIIYQAIILFAGFSVYLAQPLSSNFLQNQHDLTLKTIGTLGSIASIGTVVLSLVLGSINAHTGYLLGQLAVGISTLILWQANTLPWFTLAYFLMGGCRITRSFATAQTRNLIHQSSMGLAYGITETVSATAIIFASLVAGLLYDINPIYIFGIATCLIAISILVSARFIPQPEPCQ